MVFHKMHIFTYAFWTITVLIMSETNLMAIQVKYEPYLENQQPQIHGKWISGCKNKRGNHGKEIIPQEMRITPEGCFERTENGPQEEGQRSYKNIKDNVCKGSTVIISDQHLEHWSLSLLVNVECKSSFTMNILSWQDVGFQVQCTETSHASLIVTEPARKITYRTEDDGYTHVLIQVSWHTSMNHLLTALHTPFWKVDSDGEKPQDESPHYSSPCRPAGLFSAVINYSPGSSYQYNFKILETIFLTKSGDLYRDLQQVFPSLHVPKDGRGTANLAVYINGSKIKPDIEEKINFTNSRTFAALTLGKNPGLRMKIRTVKLGALDIFQKALNEAEIKKESHFMYLKSIDADYPECLCTDPPPYGTDSCPNGEDRLRGKKRNTPFLPLHALMDGIMNATTKLQYGFWPAKQNDTIYLRFEGPTLLSHIEVYMFTQSITVFNDRCDCNKWHPLFCASGRGGTPRHKLCDEGNTSERDYHWDTVDGCPFHKLHWDAGDDINVVRSLRIDFEGGPYQDVSEHTKPLRNVNPVYELKVFGRVLDTLVYQDSVSCFPGNGNCQKEVCRDRKTSSINKCKPYIRELLPDYGPLAGGSVLTFTGGLLQPALQQSYHNTTILRGDQDTPLCNNIQRTDENMICRALPYSDSKLVGVPQHLTVKIMIDNTMYTIGSQLWFTYQPDPIIESVTPYKAFLKETQSITVKGQYLDSIAIRPAQQIMTITLERSHHSEYNAPCKILSREAMVCTMPAIDDDVVNRAHLSLTLDGVTRYKNLTAALNLTEPLKIYPKPHFNVEGIIKLKRHSSELQLKGEMINNGVIAKDYTVKIGESNCEVVKIDYYSLFCIPPNELHNDEQLTVQLYGITYNVGYVDYVDPVISSTGIAIIISVVVLLLILLAGGLIILWWRRRSYRRKLSDWDVLQEWTEQKTTPDNSGPSQPSIIRPFSEELKDIMDGIELDSRNLEIKEEIGCGHSGKVYHGNLTQGKYTRDVAVKTLKDRHEMNSVELNEFLTEATIMKGFSHPNVLSLLGITVEDGRAFVILPYMEHGDLRGFVQNSRFEEIRFTKLIYDVAKGMNYLAEQKFVHRDLAARNCMVDSEEKVLIGDFGLARDIHENDYYRPKDRSQPLPYKWMALESIEDVSFSMKSDVWSYGVTMWEVYSHGTKPYPDIKNFQMRSYLKRGLRLEKPPTCPTEIYDLMSQCWKKDPNDRPSFVLIVSKLEQFLLERTAASSVTTKGKFVKDQVAILEAGLQSTQCKPEIHVAEKKQSVKTVVIETGSSPVYDVAFEEGTATVCQEAMVKQESSADQGRVADDISGASPTYNDACSSNASSSWDSVSSISDHVQDTANEQSQTATVAMCQLLTPRNKLEPRKLEIHQNEDDDYLQPVCSKGSKACSHK